MELWFAAHGLLDLLRMQGFWDLCAYLGHAASFVEGAQIAPAACFIALVSLSEFHFRNDFSDLSVVLASLVVHWQLWVDVAATTGAMFPEATVLLTILGVIAVSPPDVAGLCVAGALLSFFPVSWCIYVVLGLHLIQSLRSCCSSFGRKRVIVLYVAAVLWTHVAARVGVLAILGPAEIASIVYTHILTHDGAELLARFSGKSAIGVDQPRHQPTE